MLKLIIHAGNVACCFPALVTPLGFSRLQVSALQHQLSSAAPAHHQLAPQTAAVACSCGLSLPGVSLQDVRLGVNAVILFFKAKLRRRVYVGHLIATTRVDVHKR